MQPSNPGTSVVKKYRVHARLASDCWNATGHEETYALQAHEEAKLKVIKILDGLVSPNQCLN